MNGSIEIDGVKHEFIAYSNDFKTEDKHPDWKVFVSEPRGQTGAAPAARPVPQADRRAPAAAPQRANGQAPQGGNRPIPGRNAPAPQRQVPPQRKPAPVEESFEDGDSEVPF